MMFTHLDLFSGLGGFARSVSWLDGETVGFVEWDGWCRRVLAKHWPEARFHGDIKTLTAATLREWGITVWDRPVAHAARVDDREQPDDGIALTPERDARLERGSGHRGRLQRESGTQLDLITGGYPCQPFSLAGQRLGHEDDRHLWPEMRRVIDLCRPRFVLAENVSGHVSMGLDTVLAELEADGYACGAVVIPACAVNALHRRDRVWILGSRTDATVGVASVRNSDRGDGDGRTKPGNGWANGPEIRGGTTTDMADAEARGLRRGRAPGHDGQPAQRGQELPDATSDQRRTPRHGTPVASDRGSRGECGNGVEAPRPVDAGVDGLLPGLVRRPAARSAWGDPDLIRAMWADGSWERDLPRVVADEPERRQKLQAAGNAIVPIVAYEILRVMLGDEQEDA